MNRSIKAVFRKIGRYIRAGAGIIQQPHPKLILSPIPVRVLILAGLAFLLAGCSAFSESGRAASDADLARETLIAYLDHLRAGRYREAAALYGGSYEALTEANPSTDPQDHAALLEAACTVNGYQCLKVRSVDLKEQVRPGEFGFMVSFETPSGDLFARGPCCGADATEMPEQTSFLFTVSRQGQGGFHVQTLAVYVP